MTEFETFYETVFKPLLENLARYESGPVLSGDQNIKEASWDRKAAFLLWMNVKGMQPPW